MTDEHDHEDHDHEDHDHGDEVGRIVQISSGVTGGSCEYCSDGLSNDFAERVNHYLEHGGLLLHVGAQSDQYREGKPLTNTVAVIGFPE
jgi:hypothetical protein